MKKLALLTVVVILALASCDNDYSETDNTYGIDKDKITTPANKYACDDCDDIDKDKVKPPGGN